MKTMARSTRRHGLSLIEILVALAIFVIGILAVLRIFPRGLGVVQTVGDRNEAVRLAEARINELRQREASLPAFILPAALPSGVDSSDPTTFGLFRPDPTVAVGYQPGELSPYDLDVPYADPAEQDLLHRMMAQERLIVGEKALVPRGIYVDPGSGQVQGAAQPYLTLFGPIQSYPGGGAKLSVWRMYEQVDPIELRRTVVTDASGVNSYRDRAVFAVVDGGLNDFTRTPAPDKLLFELSSMDRELLVRLAYLDDNGVVQWEQLPPQVLPGQAYGSSQPVVELPLQTGAGVAITRVVPASVTVRQALRPTTGPDALPDADPAAARRYEYDARAAGRGVLWLPPQLAGEQLWLEYVVDDWRVLRETATVTVGPGNVVQESELQLAARWLQQGYRPQVVVISSGEALPIRTADWDSDSTYADGGRVPLDPTGTVSAPEGSQDVYVYYKRLGNWAVSTSIAPETYLLEDVTTADYPIQSALVTVDNSFYTDPDSGQPYTDLLFKPSEAGRTVAVTYEVGLGSGDRELVVGELHVVPPLPNRSDPSTGQPRCAVRLKRPGVAVSAGAGARPLIHAIEGRSLHVRVAYDDQMLHRAATPVVTATPGRYETAEQLVEMSWYVRR